jgi:hypothetical protein
VKTRRQAVIWRPCPECHEASKHHLLKFGFSPTGSIYLGFITEGRLAAVLITPSLGVPNWSVIYINTVPSKSYTGNILGIGRNKSQTFYFSRSITKFEDETKGGQEPGSP